MSYQIHFFNVDGAGQSLWRETHEEALDLVLACQEAGCSDLAVERVTVRDQTDEFLEFARVRRAMADPNSVFVFGSNLAGLHAGGAAREAQERYGAEEYQSHGQRGRAYAIPTMVTPGGESLTLSLISRWVRKFLQDAATEPARRFIVTKIGCGIAGFTEEQIAPMFVGHPANVELPLGWDRLLNGARTTE